MGNKMEARIFPAQVNEIPPMLEFVCQQAESAGIHPKRIMHLQLAIEESAVNIASYAYEIPPGEILVRVEEDTKQFKVDLIDTGVPFDPLSVTEPDLEAGIDEREIGGLGILFIRRVMDEVHYSRIEDKNIVSLVVYKAK